MPLTVNVGILRKVTGSRDAKGRLPKDARELVAPDFGRHGGGSVRIGVIEAQ